MSIHIAGWIEIKIVDNLGNYDHTDSYHWNTYCNINEIRKKSYKGLVTLLYDDQNFNEEPELPSDVSALVKDNLKIFDTCFNFTIKFWSEIVPSVKYDNLADDEQALLHLMQNLATEHGDQNVRLIAWFYL